MKSYKKLGIGVAVGTVGGIAYSVVKKLRTRDRSKYCIMHEGGLYCYDSKESLLNEGPEDMLNVTISKSDTKLSPDEMDDILHQKLEELKTLVELSEY